MYTECVYDIRKLEIFIGTSVVEQSINHDLHITKPV